MFERRIKILLGTLAFFIALLLARAGWLQVVQGSDWEKKAQETGRHSSWLETSRGRILDFKDHVVAEDAACIDAAVDYRAIDPDAKESQEWLKAQAKARLQARNAFKGDRDDRSRLIDAEVDRIKEDLKVLWGKLAQVSGKTPEEIEEIKESIKRRVRMRQRYVSYRKYEAAKARHDNEAREPSPAWYKWLVDDTQSAPQIESFNVLVAEQTETHAILHAIDNESYLVLDKLRERCPGLELKKGVRRNYPYLDVACHVIGQLSPVIREDLEKDPNLDKDEAKKYYYNDLIGRSGVERLAEQVLRGSRGQVIRQAGNDAVTQTIAAKPGEDVKITIDMDLQMRIQEAFLRYKEEDDKNNPGHDLRAVQIPVHEMHGAAVVIDVPTGQVRAMVSYPTFDLNQYDANYQQMVKDVKNLPLLNRATQAALEPGSTVKPMVGLSAITAGLCGVDETIECTGYLVIDGRVHREGRCWVASKFGHKLSSVAHHPIPWNAPHPTGFLTFADGLERSCNVFFENMADRLKIEGLNHWMGEFGLGRITEVGLTEVPGRIPDPKIKLPNWRSATWFSGIGQSQVLATPIQMANVATTIARRGIWVRPHLLVNESAEVERRDLHLNQAAVDEAFTGMINVVNAPAGTGTILHRDDVLVAGKTGTAQAAKFNLLRYAENGKPMRDENGRLVRDFPPISTPESPNRDMPWYRGAGNSGDELGHAWFIGFAPAHNPQIAFAVLVEYGGSGGKDAGPVAKAILDACMELNYFSKSAAN